MYILQKQLKNLESLLTPNKAVIIYGPRQCGKTTLLNKFLEKSKNPYLLLNGEDIFVQEQLTSQSIEKLKNLIGNYKLLAIDEAQKIKNIGINLKLILDHITDIKIIATGSSSFELANQLSEPLTGRKYTLKLYPLAQLEIQSIENSIATKANLETRLIYGAYPEIVTLEDNQKRERQLKEITNSYLYKDIVELEGLKHPDKIAKLLQLLAFQIGKEVSFNELSSHVNMSKNTAEKYLNLLEKTFVIFKLSGFSRNLRKEISKNPRYYFYDTGIRNALINNFNPLNLRDDIGMLWENYIIIERIKKQEYLNQTANNYFWRTYDQKEIDLIEEKKGNLYGYEIKWRLKKTKPPHDWLNTYSNAHYELIHKDNYLSFIT